MLSICAAAVCSHRAALANHAFQHQALPVLSLEYDAGVPTSFGRILRAHAKDEGAHPSGLEADWVSSTPAVFSFHIRACTMEKERLTIAVAIHAR